MTGFGLTDKGAFRKDNQDCFIIEKCEQANCYIIALCDGMGGEKAGEIASALSDKAFVEFIFQRLCQRNRKIYERRKLLLDACEEANGVAWEYSRFDEAYNGMGTTIVGGIVDEDGRFDLINVGDSRAYLISRKNLQMKQITRDHSLVEDMVVAGIITREEAKTHPQRNVITRAVGSEETVEADYFEGTLLRGEVLLLCSDGLYTTLTNEEILATIKEYDEPEKICGDLMYKALAAGARDNVTVLAIRR